MFNKEDTERKLIVELVLSKWAGGDEQPWCEVHSEEDGDELFRTPGDAQMWIQAHRQAIKWLEDHAEEILEHAVKLYYTV